MEKSAKVRVTGSVQGVFYRAETRNKARSLGIYGWVRNLPGGDVEALFEGEQERIRELISWCRRGPPNARVEEVDVEWIKPEGNKGFNIRY